MQVNGTNIPDTIVTDGDEKNPWKATGDFIAVDLKNPRYTYDRIVDGKRQQRWFKPKHFAKAKAEADARARAEKAGA